MKNSLFHLAILISLISSCKKNDHFIADSTENSKIINRLVSGSNCEKFYRLLVGNKMEDLWSINQTTDGGYILCGSSETIAESEHDILIVKTDCFGETIWIKTITNDYADFGYDVKELRNGGYLLLSNYSLNQSNSGIVSYEGQLIKLNNSGDVIWKKSYNFGSKTTFYRVSESINGEFTIIGSDNSNGGFIFQTDSSGLENWRYQFSSGCNLFGLKTMTNSNHLVCGSLNVNGQNDIFIAELNSFGNLIWTKTIDKNNLSNQALAIDIINNDIIVSGYNRTSGINLPGFLMKIDSIGNEIWYKSFEADGISEISNCVVTHDNQILCAGNKSNTLSLLKINSNNGSLIWENNKQISVLTRDIKLTVDNGFILAGNMFVSIGNRDGFMLKTDLNGN